MTSINLLLREHIIYQYSKIDVDNRVKPHKKRATEKILQFNDLVIFFVIICINIALPNQPNTL